MGTKNHSCADCGFLALRDPKSRELVEAESSVRDSPLFPQVYDAQLKTHLPMYPVYPICFQRAYPLGREMTQAIGTQNANIPQVGFDAFYHVIQARRRCGEFTPWQQGFSPKEHREILDRESRLKFEAEEREKDRTWREQQRRLDLESREAQRSEDDKRHREQLDTLRRHHRWDLIVFGGIVTVAIVGSTIIGSMIQAGWIGHTDSANRGYTYPAEASPTPTATPTPQLARLP